MPEEFKGSTDDLIEQMKADEVVGATKMSPRDWAKTKSIAPQLVYYYIKAGHIKKETCQCGRSVIDVEDAEAFWREKHGITDEDEPE